MYITRPAIISDCNRIYDLICLKAEFDRSMGGFNGEITNSVEKLEETLFGSYPFAQIILAEINSISIGLAFYHFRYSSFSGIPSIWLDDLYVIETHRSRGIGKLLMSSVQDDAKRRKCSHIAWTASPNNLRGQEFYKQMGAIIERFDGTRPYYKLDIKNSVG